MSRQRTENVLESLKCAEYFSSLALAHVYHQLQLKMRILAYRVETGGLFIFVCENAVWPLQRTCDVHAHDGQDFGRCELRVCINLPGQHTYSNKFFDQILK